MLEQQPLTRVSAAESDSDDDVSYHGNRGQKLKKRARFVHEGQLAPPSGPDAYREASLTREKHK
jgi:hypothetical protein